MPLLAVPLEALWMILGIGLVAAATTGFVAGIWCAPWFEDRSLRRSIQQFESLYDKTVSRLKRADAACQLLASRSEWIPSSDQAAELESYRTRLSDTLRGLFRRTERPPLEASNEPDERPTINWLREPLDPSTGIPGRAAFDSNLSLWLQSPRDEVRPGALLFVRMDSADQLRARCGPETVEKLQTRLANVLVRCFRDEDLTCRIASDVFVVLMPQVEEGEGLRLAEIARQSVRSHRFRTDEHSAEVLVTASFGFTVCSHDDHPDLVLDRAGDAASRARSAGRNQLRRFGPALPAHS